MYSLLTLEQRHKVDSLFAEMNDTQKLGQMVCETGQSLRSRSLPPKAWLKKYPLGFLFVGSEVIDVQAHTVGEVNEVKNAADGKGSVPVMFCGDYERGIGDNIAGYTKLPRAMSLSSSFSPEFAYDYGRIIGEEARELNIHWAFGPVADLNTNCENPVTNVRSMSDDPDHAIKMLSQVVRGMQEAGCAATPKHFPGDGTDTRNQHLATTLNLLDKAEWDKQHGRVFKALIDAGVMSIMIGHIGFPASEECDPETGNFRPATVSKKLLTELLRGELDFKGLIVSDALCMVGYLSWADYEDRIIDSFNAGIDVFLWPDCEKFFPLMLAALKDGRISRERLDNSVRRILAFKTILFDARPKHVPRTIKENKAKAAEIVNRSITLLRNRANLLPLKLNPGAKVLVLYSPDSDNRGAYQGVSEFSLNLKRRGFQVSWAAFSNLAEQVTVIDSYDAIFQICNSQPQYSCYRGVNSMGAWELFTKNIWKKCIFISFGTPYYLYDVPNAENYINVCSDGPDSVNATLAAVFGEIPFAGRSPVGIKHCFAFGDGIITEK